MIRREIDAVFVNAICNDPAVSKFVNYTGEPIDCSAVTDVALFLSNGEDALAGFDCIGRHKWQTHLFFGPTCRGRRAIDTYGDMVKWMRPYADSIEGAVPLRNRAARWFVRQVGFKSQGEDVYEVEGPVELFKMELV